MNKFLLYIIIILFPVFLCAQTLQVIPATNQFYAGEQIPLQIQALLANGSIDTNYNGYVSLISDIYPILFIGKKDLSSTTADQKNNAQFFLTRGENNTFYMIPFESGSCKLTLTELFQNSSIPYTDHSTNFEVFQPLNTLVLNEIMFRTVNDSAYEYLELIKLSSSMMSLSNIEIFRTSSTKTNKILLFQSTSARSAEQDDLLVLTADQQALFSLFPSAQANCFVTNQLLSTITTTGQISVLVDGKMSDFVRYDSDWGAVSGETSMPQNTSLERKTLSVPAWKEEAWTASLSRAGETSFYGTPGQENSTTLPSDHSSVEINIILPENPQDPYNSPVPVICTVSVPGSIEVSLLDSTGLRKKVIQPWTPVGNSGTYYFNGLDDSGRRLPLGMYVLKISYINDELGLTEKKGALVILKDQ